MLFRAADEGKAPSLEGGKLYYKSISSYSFVIKYNIEIRKTLVNML